MNPGKYVNSLTVGGSCTGEPQQNNLTIHGRNAKKAASQRQQILSRTGLMSLTQENADDVRSLV